jgi:hypothetical protein
MPTGPQVSHAARPIKAKSRKHLTDHEEIVVSEMGLLIECSSVRFQVLKATSMNMAVFLDVAPCSLVEIDRRFRGAYRLQYQRDQRPHDAGSITSANFYQTADGAMYQMTAIFKLVCCFYLLSRTYQVPFHLMLLFK